MALIGRIFVVLIAFLVASALGGLVLALGLLPADFDEFLMMPGGHAGFGIAVAISGFLISGYALLPAMLFILIAEAFRLRSFLWYAAFGAVLALLITQGSNLWIVSAPGYSLGGHDREVFAAAGIAAGLAYWAMAGRRAGAWRAARTRPQIAAG